MSDLHKDLGFAWRSVRRRPAFSLAVVVTLALGIGVGTAVFSMVDTLLLRPLPFPEPERLVHVWGTDPQQGWNRLYVSAPDFADLRRADGAFAETGAFLNREYNLSRSEQAPERVAIARVTPGVFRTLGVEAAHGRVILTEDERSRRAVAVLSHDLWTHRFAADPDVVGSTVLLHSEPYEVIGVMPPSFSFPMPTTEVWIPAHLDPGAVERSLREYQVVARLSPGVGLDRARQETAAFAARLARDYPDANGNYGLEVVPLREALLFAYDRVTLVSWILAAAVLFVLLLVCANVGNLMLARFAARHQEVAIRNALGAVPRRLVRQFLAESLLLSLLGAALGLLLAHWTIRAAIVTVPDNLYRVGEFGLDPTAVLVAVGLALLTTLLVGLVPALQVIKPQVVEALKEGSHTTGGRRVRRRYDVLVVTQLAVAVVLLVGALLMVQSVRQLRRVDPGFATSDVLALKLSLPTQYGDAEAARFVDEARQRLLALPGVEAAAAVNFLPLNNETLWRPFRREGGQVGAEEERPWAIVLYASPGYFDTLEVPLVSGRDLDERDVAEAPMTVVVNRSLARRYWPGEEAVGRRLSLTPEGEDPVWRTVVGVVEDYHHVDLETSPNPQIFVPYAQTPWTYFRLLVRTGTPPMAVLPSVRRAIGGIDPNVPLTEVQTLAEVTMESLTIQDFISRALTALGLGALLLAAIGLYGVMALWVDRSLHEIGLRMALGAERGSVLGLVIRRAGRRVLLGLGIGLALAAGMTFGLSRLLFGVEPLDLPTFLGVAGVLALVSLVASYLPALRASRVDPQRALRYE